MESWVLWVIAAVIFAIGEIATLGFFLAPFAGGALFAALVAGLGAGAAAQWATFIVTSVVALTLVRPIARSHRRMPPQLRTGTSALIGHTALVMAPVTRDGGEVKLEGEVWSARPLDEEESYAVGARVQVVEIKGATVVVSD